MVLEDLFEVPMFRPPRYLIEEDEATAGAQLVTARSYLPDVREETVP